MTSTAASTTTAATTSHRRRRVTGVCARGAEARRQGVRLEQSLGTDRPPGFAELGGLQLVGGTAGSVWRKELRGAPHHFVEAAHDARLPAGLSQLGKAEHQREADEEGQHE